MKYTFNKNAHYSTPPEWGRKLKPRLGNFNYRWTVDFTESCWFDKTLLGEDALDWNFKLCGVTGALSANDVNAIMCAARPNLNEKNTWEVTWYINDNEGKKLWSLHPMIVKLEETLIITMARIGKNVNFVAYIAGKEEDTQKKSWEMKDNMYRFVGPSFGGNRKTPHKMELWVGRDNLK